MEQILQTLGFTDPVSTLWNILAYIGMIMIITAVVSQKARNQLFFWGPLSLLFYALFHLHNYFLVGLQLIIAFSGLLNLLKVKKFAAVLIIAFSLPVYVCLLASHQIIGLWAWIGSLGFWTIALSFVFLPKKSSFALMALGSIFLVVYSLALGIWVYFMLNLVLLVVNILKLRIKSISKKDG